MDRNSFQDEIHNELRQLSSELKSLASDLWEHPEPAWHEEYAVRRIGEFLQKQGLDITENICDIPTAFRAESGSGDGPVFAFAAEYDALPAGHACGHNLIAAASTGAMCAASRLLARKALPGKLVLLGTPAEEAGSGKVVMLERGVLRGIDAVMMAHPGWCTIPDRGSLAIRRYDVTFHGKSAHAAGSPELGINALDGVMLLFAGVNAYRQQIPEYCRIHGIVTNGGSMPNIIPDTAVCRFYLRSADETWMDRIDRRFAEMVQGAALMSGTTAEQKRYFVDCMSRKPNPALNASYEEIMTSLGETISPIPRVGRGSSDFGNFSRAVPGAHPYFAISDHKIAGHSEAFLEAAHSPRGLDAMVKAAEALACTACRFLTDQSFRAEVKRYFEEP